MMMMSNIYILRVIIFSLLGVVYEGRFIKKLVCDVVQPRKQSNKLRKNGKYQREKKTDRAHLKTPPLKNISTDRLPP